MTAQEMAATFTLGQLRVMAKFTSKTKARSEEYSRILEAIGILEC